jgi:hypothetical protein
MWEESRRATIGNGWRCEVRVGQGSDKGDSADEGDSEEE